MKQPNKTLLEKKWVLTAMWFFIIAFSWFFYYFLDKEITNVQTYRLNNLNEKKENHEVIKMTKEEYEQKIEEQHFIWILNALNSFWEKNIVISKNEEAKNILLWNWKFQFIENKEYEQKLLLEYLTKTFNLKEEIIKNILNNSENQLLFKTSELLPDLFYFNLLEWKESFYVVWLENPSSLPWQKNSFTIKDSIQSRFFIVLNKISEKFKLDSDEKKLNFLNENKENMKKDMKFVFIYKISKKDMSIFSENEIKSFYKNNLSNLLIKTLSSQLYNEKYFIDNDKTENQTPIIEDFMKQEDDFIQKIQKN